MSHVSAPYAGGVWRDLFSPDKKIPDDGPHKPNYVAGVVNALIACLVYTDLISVGRCDVADYVSRGFADIEILTIRGPVFRALLRTIVYILDLSMRRRAIFSDCTRRLSASNSERFLPNNLVDGRWVIR